jgi:hypothetical protein
LNQIKTTTHPRAILHALSSYGGTVVAVVVLRHEGGRAGLPDGDDWQWTGVCASPERARYEAWRGMTEGRAAA